MNTDRIFHVIDSHTAGNSTRVLLEGVPKLEGTSMIDKKRYFQRHYDWIRTTLMQEPRGNSGVAAIIIPPPDKESADYGLLFADNRGYVDMCIHGTIGVATTLIEMGIVSSEVAGSKGIVFDSPAGKVNAIAKCRNGTVESVSVSNVASYYLREVEIELPNKRRVVVDLSFGGNTYAYVDATSLGLKVRAQDLRSLLSTADAILKKVQSKSFVSSMDLKNSITGVSLYEDIAPRKARNIMIANHGLFDRSPCGTGTCGRMAVLNFKGKLGQNSEFVNYGITGLNFIGEIERIITSRRQTMIIPKITGTAFLTGIADLIISKGDSLGRGFTM